MRSDRPGDIPAVFDLFDVAGVSCLSLLISLAFVYRFISGLISATHFDPVYHMPAQSIESMGGKVGMR